MTTDIKSRLPPNFIGLLENLCRGFLRNRPINLYNFAADHFDSELAKRTLNELTLEGEFTPGGVFRRPGEDAAKTKKSKLELFIEKKTAETAKRLSEEAISVAVKDELTAAGTVPSVEKFGDTSVELVKGTQSAEVSIIKNVKSKEYGSETNVQKQQSDKKVRKTSKESVKKLDKKSSEKQPVSSEQKERSSQANLDVGKKSAEGEATVLSTKKSGLIEVKKEKSAEGKSSKTSAKRKKSSETKGEKGTENQTTAVNDGKKAGKTNADEIKKKPSLEKKLESLFGEGKKRDSPNAKKNKRPDTKSLDIMGKKLAQETDAFMEVKSANDVIGQDDEGEPERDWADEKTPSPRLNEEKLPAKQDDTKRTYASAEMGISAKSKKDKVVVDEGDEVAVDEGTPALTAIETLPTDVIPSETLRTSAADSKGKVGIQTKDGETEPPCRQEPTSSPTLPSKVKSPKVDKSVAHKRTEEKAKSNNVLPELTLSEMQRYHNWPDERTPSPRPSSRSWLPGNRQRQMLALTDSVKSDGSCNQVTMLVRKVDEEKIRVTWRKGDSPPPYVQDPTADPKQTQSDKSYLKIGAPAVAEVADTHSKGPEATPVTPSEVKSPKSDDSFVYTDLEEMSESEEYLPISTWSEMQCYDEWPDENTPPPKLSGGVWLPGRRDRPMFALTDSVKSAGSFDRVTNAGQKINKENGGPIWREAETPPLYMQDKAQETENKQDTLLDTKPIISRDNTLIDKSESEDIAPNRIEVDVNKTEESTLYPAPNPVIKSSEKLQQIGLEPATVRKIYLPGDKGSEELIVNKVATDEAKVSCSLRAIATPPAVVPIKSLETNVVGNRSKVAVVKSGEAERSSNLMENAKSQDFMLYGDKYPGIGQETGLFTPAIETAAQLIAVKAHKAKLQVVPIKSLKLKPTLLETVKATDFMLYGDKSPGIGTDTSILTPVVQTEAELIAIKSRKIEGTAGPAKLQVVPIRSDKLKPTGTLLDAINATAKVTENAVSEDLTSKEVKSVGTRQKESIQASSVKYQPEKHTTKVTEVQPGNQYYSTSVELIVNDKVADVAVSAPITKVVPIRSWQKKCVSENIDVGTLQKALSEAMVKDVKPRQKAQSNAEPPATKMFNFIPRDEWPDERTPSPRLSDKVLFTGQRYEAGRICALTGNYVSDEFLLNEAEAVNARTEAMKVSTKTDEVRKVSSKPDGAIQITTVKVEAMPVDAQKDETVPVNANSLQAQVCAMIMRQEESSPPPEMNDEFQALTSKASEGGQAYIAIDDAESKDMSPDLKPSVTVNEKKTNEASLADPWREDVTPLPVMKADTASLQPKPDEPEATYPLMANAGSSGSIADEVEIVFKNSGETRSKTTYIWRDEGTPPHVIQALTSKASEGEQADTAIDDAKSKDMTLDLKSSVTVYETKKNEASLADPWREVTPPLTPPPVMKADTASLPPKPDEPKSTYPLMTNAGSTGSITDEAEIVFQNSGETKNDSDYMWRDEATPPPEVVQPNESEEAYGIVAKAISDAVDNIKSTEVKDICQWREKATHLPVMKSEVLIRQTDSQRTYALVDNTTSRDLMLKEDTVVAVRANSAESGPPQTWREEGTPPPVMQSEVQSDTEETKSTETMTTNTDEAIPVSAKTDVVTTNNFESDEVVPVTTKEDEVILVKVEKEETFTSNPQKDDVSMIIMRQEESTPPPQTDTKVSKSTETYITNTEDGIPVSATTDEVVPVNVTTGEALTSDQQQDDVSTIIMRQRESTPPPQTGTKATKSTETYITNADEVTSFSANTDEVLPVSVKKDEVIIPVNVKTEEVLTSNQQQDDVSTSIMRQRESTPPPQTGTKITFTSNQQKDGVSMIIMRQEESTPPPQTGTKATKSTDSYITNADEGIPVSAKTDEVVPVNVTTEEALTSNQQQEDVNTIIMRQRESTPPPQTGTKITFTSNPQKDDVSMIIMRQEESTPPPQIDSQVSKSTESYLTNADEGIPVSAKKDEVVPVNVTTEEALTNNQQQDDISMIIMHQRESTPPPETDTKAADFTIPVSAKADALGKDNLKSAEVLPVIAKEDEAVPVIVKEEKATNRGKDDINTVMMRQEQSTSPVMEDEPQARRNKNGNGVVATSVTAITSQRMSSVHATGSKVNSAPSGNRAVTHKNSSSDAKKFDTKSSTRTVTSGSSSRGTSPIKMCKDCKRPVKPSQEKNVVKKEVGEPSRSSTESRTEEIPTGNSVKPNAYEMIKIQPVTATVTRKCSSCEMPSAELVEEWEAEPSLLRYL